MAATHNGGFYAGHRVLVWTAGLILAVVLLASFMSRDDSVPVRAASVDRGMVRSTISTNGKIEPISDFQAHAPVGTTVKRLLVKEGDRVKKGQLLVELDDAEARSQGARALAQVRAAQAEISAVQKGGTREELLTMDAELVKAKGARDTAQRNLDALQSLLPKGAATPGEVKQAQNQLADANAQVELLEQKRTARYAAPEIASVEAQQHQAEAAYAATQDVLRQMNIVAPFDGVVYALPVRLGAYVNPGDLVLQEADLSHVLVRTFVDEPDVARLAPGQKIELSWDAIPGRIWNGEVTTVPAEVKVRGTRNVGEVTCTVDNSDLKLLPNVNVSVTIVTGEHRGVLTVPREAIRQDDGKVFVYEINRNHELERRNIQISIATLTRVEVTGGIEEHAIVALGSTNSKPLHTGLSVKIIQ
ncbi:MAG TPA: efflux RND transporter periplasmic adaptor subunit [Terriglobales bacterium]|nr:efflux RND transporter periplasmic adaptor subunit [Terriglobales bacterium]